MITNVEYGATVFPRTAIGTYGYKVPVLVDVQQPVTDSPHVKKIIVGIHGDVPVECFPRIAGYLAELTKSPRLGDFELVMARPHFFQSQYKHSYEELPLDIFQKKRRSSKKFFYELDNYLTPHQRTVAIHFLGNNIDITSGENVLSNCTNRGIATHLVGVGSINPLALLHLSKHTRGSWEILGQDNSVTGIAAQAILSGVRDVDHCVNIRNNTKDSHGFTLGPSIKEFDSDDYAPLSPAHISRVLFLNPPDFTAPVQPSEWKFWAKKPENPFSIEIGRDTVHPGFTDFNELSPTKQDEAEKELLEVLRFIAIRDKDADFYSSLAKEHGEKYSNLFPQDSTNTILEVLKRTIIDEDYLSLLNLVSVSNRSIDKALEIEPIEIPPLPPREISNPAKPAKRYELIQALTPITSIIPLGPFNITLSHTSPKITIKIASTNKITFGRNSSSVVHINDTAVSRAQCTIFEKNGDVFIRDDDSHNGTMVNRTKISSEQKLQNGDKISFCDYVFTININANPSAETIATT